VSTVTELATLTGLPAEQLARLLGAPRRTVDGWLMGHANGRAEPVERTARLLKAVAPLGATPAERRAELFRSSGGASLFHRLLGEVPRPATVHANSINVRHRLGV